MGATCLVDHDPEGTSDFGIISAREQELSPADDHRERVIELVPGAGGELAQAVELALLEPSLFGVALPDETP